ncbi:MAG TPA: FAD-dependent oxidoreductase [Gallionellaceae bacterium]|nr:FAD-dependent oxidoreductase [Gallionellaceae bacterium]
MSKLITDEVASQIRQQFQALREPVQLVFFTQPHACGACADQQELLESIVNLSDKLTLAIHPLDSAAALEHRIARAPATVVRGTRDYGIRFYGLTGGYEFGSLLEAIRLVSLGAAAVDPAVAALAALLRSPIHLEVMVTLSCPYCPKMVHVAHQLAVASEHVTADMVDAGEFPDVANRYDVHGVPLTAVNGRRGFEGALPPEQAVLEMLKVADPDAYERIEAGLREAQGLRHAVEAKADELYDVIVVGAGPAGLTAALYAQRKGRKTVLIGKQAGGQINDTATVENYPGVVQIGGAELSRALREHVEAYPVSERCHTEVASIEQAGGVFVAHTEDGHAYRGRSVIYCTGKRNRRLDVPGEERFIGRGIAWCATCDAPLYRDKRVAVVGGGNSAFTAVRDLLHYAAEIHLVHGRDTFRADPALVDEIRRAEADGKVRLHLNSQVREYLGRDALEGVRLAAKDGSALYDIALDGVFLEIGLEPNSTAIATLVKLNDHGEVPVTRDQATTVAGLYAAGDVTDEADKQIVIAAGAGAKAALAADRYLASVEQHAVTGAAR